MLTDTMFDLKKILLNAKINMFVGHLPLFFSTFYNNGKLNNNTNPL